ncbi:MAG TPA: hypothetical protein VJR90_01680 [Gammaproteobacteria bacterium]|nr:hypothetical protein [Gammaproteobacteria bacterium]
MEGPISLAQSGAEGAVVMLGKLAEFSGAWMLACRYVMAGAIISPQQVCTVCRCRRIQAAQLPVGGCGAAPYFVTCLTVRLPFQNFRTFGTKTVVWLWCYINSAADFTESIKA